MTQISARLIGLPLVSTVWHSADESQPARNNCPRLPHSVDSRFGLYHVAVVLSFLRSPISLSEIWVLSSRLEKSLNSVKELEKHLISLLGLEKSLKFRNLFILYHFSEKLNDFAGKICASTTNNKLAITMGQLVGITHVRIHGENLIFASILCTSHQVMWGCPPHAFVFRSNVIGRM